MGDKKQILDRLYYLGYLTDEEYNICMDNCIYITITDNMMSFKKDKQETIKNVQTIIDEINNKK